MAFNFPVRPNYLEEYTEHGVTYFWNSYGWIRKKTVVVPPVADILLDGNTVSEDAPFNTLIGTFSTVNTTGVPTFFLTDDSDGRFSLTGNQLFSAAAFNYDESRQHFITIAVDGVTPEITPRTFAIEVLDVLEVKPPDMAMPWLRGEGYDTYAIGPVETLYMSMQTAPFVMVNDLVLVHVMLVNTSAIRPTYTIPPGWNLAGESECSSVDLTCVNLLLWKIFAAEADGACFVPFAAATAYGKMWGVTDVWVDHPIEVMAVTDNVFDSQQITLPSIETHGPNRLYWCSVLGVSSEAHLGQARLEFGAFPDWRYDWYDVSYVSNFIIWHPAEEAKIVENKANYDRVQEALCAIAVTL